MPVLRPTTDGVVTIRPPAPGDGALLVAGRDDEFHRFLGAGSPDPDPLGCIVVGGDVVGWVDHDRDRSWLAPDEVNVGYHVFAPARGRGYATRAVKLLVHHLAVDTDARRATFLIDPANERSQAVARRAGARRLADLDGNPYFASDVPPLEYTDGVVTIRRPGDVLAGDLTGLHRPEEFGSGPIWSFTVDTATVPCVAAVECDLANEHVPAGEAGVSYRVHPDHRGRGIVVSAVRLLLAFLADHTAAPRAHLVFDVDDVTSRRVAVAIAAVEVGSWTTDGGRRMVRNVVDVPR